MRCKLETEPMRGRDGTWTLMISGLPQEALKLFDRLHGKDVEVELKLHRDRRSLDANAYFHLLANKIAKALGSSDEDIKIQLVERYGALDRDANGKLISFTLPDGVPPTKIYPYTLFIGRQFMNGTMINKYVIYKRTHEMNTEEFAHLIDGTIQDAQELGIETITPEEKQRMMESYERKFGKKMDDEKEMESTAVDGWM